MIQEFNWVEARMDPYSGGGYDPFKTYSSFDEIASFKAAIEVKSSHQTEISPSKRERLVNSQSQCSFFYPNFEDDELPIQNLNFFENFFAEDLYIENSI